MTFRSAILASLVRTSSWTPSTKAAPSSFCSLKFSNGRTAIPVVTGCRINSLFQTIQPAAAARATNDAANSAIRWIASHPFCCHARRLPVWRARIGSCFSQRSKSSASARAEEYRRFGSFSRHLRQDCTEIAIYLRIQHTRISRLRLTEVTGSFRRLFHRQRAADRSTIGKALRQVHRHL